MSVLVSISCITYNHVEYIRECLDGILLQECKFDFEVLIHDDASTDGTSEIIREYQARYPDIIKPLIQTENQYGKGVRGMNATFNFPRSVGRYIALCEGDDYWTDRFKLQKQVDFLDRNQDFSMCFHNAFLFYQDTGTQEIFRPLEEREYTGAEILRNWTIPTASVVFRNSDIDFKRSQNPRYIYGDIILFLTLAEYGKLWCIKEAMSVYRIHAGGMTSERMTVKKLNALILHQKEIQMDFSRKYAQILNKDIGGSLMFLAFLQLKEARLSTFKSVYESFRYDPGRLFHNFRSVFANRIKKLNRRM